MTYQELKTLKDGPEKKFRLIKAYGGALRLHVADPHKLSCAEIVKILDEIITLEGC